MHEIARMRQAKEAPNGEVGAPVVPPRPAGVAAQQTHPHTLLGLGLRLRLRLRLSLTLRLHLGEGLRLREAGALVAREASM